jgi:hypothetical protein
MRIYSNMPKHLVLDCSRDEQKAIKLAIMKKMLDEGKWTSISEYVWPILAKQVGMEYKGKQGTKVRNHAGHYVTDK